MRNIQLHRKLHTTRHVLDSFSTIRKHNTTYKFTAQANNEEAKEYSPWFGKNLWKKNRQQNRGSFGENKNNE